MAKKGLQEGVQGVLNQLPSLLLNYRLQQDAQVKSLATKSAENIIKNSANYTDESQFDNSVDHINNMFATHAGDPAMQAAKLTALETLSNTRTSFVKREDATADLSLLTRKANKYIGELRTEDMSKVINDMTRVIGENKNYMDRGSLKSAKDQLDNYIEWYTVAKPVMAADTDPNTIGLQADENIMKAGTLLSMNRTNDAVKWYMKSGVSAANNAKDQIKNAVGTSLRVNIRGMNGLNAANADESYTSALIHDIQLPAQGDIDAASVPMYKDMFQDNVDNLLLKSGWEKDMFAEGMNGGQPYDQSANGVIEYLKDSGVWGDMDASVKLLENKIDFPGWGIKNRENTYSARHFLFQLDALDKLDQAELMIGSVNNTSKQSVLGTIKNILGNDAETNEVANEIGNIATTPIEPSQVIQTGPNSYKSTTQKIIEDPVVRALNDIAAKQKADEQQTAIDASGSIMFDEQANQEIAQMAYMDEALKALNTNMRASVPSLDEDMAEASSMPMPLAGTLPGGDPGFPEIGQGWQTPDEAGIPSIEDIAASQNRQKAMEALEAISPAQVRRSPANIQADISPVATGRGVPEQASSKLPKKNRGESNQEYVDSLNLDGESEFAATIKNVYQEVEVGEAANIKAELDKLYQERSDAFLDPSFNANSKKAKAIDNKIAKLEAAQAKAIDIQGMAPDEQIDTIILEMFENQSDYLPKGMKKFKSLNEFIDYLSKAGSVKPVNQSTGSENQEYWPEEGY